MKTSYLKRNLAALRDNIRTIIPLGLKRALRHPHKAFCNANNYFRAKIILRDYTTHYRKSQQIYMSEGNTPEPIVKSVSDLGADLGALVLFPQGRNSFIDLPNNYLELIERIHNDVKPKLDKSSNCFFFPPLGLEPISERTEDVPAFKNKEIIAIRLKNPLDIDGLQDLSFSIMQELERKVYRSYVIVDKVYIYRNVVSRAIPKLSWLWHYDNHPNEILKVMIYLTDVNEQSVHLKFSVRLNR